MGRPILNLVDPLCNLLTAILTYSNTVFPPYRLHFLSPHRFRCLVTSALEQISGDSAHSHTLTELTDEVTEYEYELDEKSGDRVVLGRGAYGTVYSALDFVTKKKMAVKEIRESNAG